MGHISMLVGLSPIRNTVLDMTDIGVKHERIYYPVDLDAFLKKSESTLCKAKWATDF